MAHLKIKFYYFGHVLDFLLIFADFRKHSICLYLENKRVQSLPATILSVCTAVL